MKRTRATGWRWTARGESMLDKRFADMADEQVVGLAQQGDSVAVEYLLSKVQELRALQGAQLLPHRSGP